MPQHGEEDEAHAAVGWCSAARVCSKKAPSEGCAEDLGEEVLNPL